MAPEASQLAPSSPSQSPAPKRKLWKFVVAFLAIILFSLVAFVGVAIFEQWRGERAVERLAEALRQAEQEIYQKQLADAVGGKTPQETLRLYIEAVEKGDYELASKYWVMEKQEKDLENLRKYSADGRQRYLQLLKEVLQRPGSYGPDEKYYGFDAPIVVEMALYPSKVWKVLEI